MRCLSFVTVALLPLVFAAPTPGEGGDTYTGAGGNASGGSVSKNIGDGAATPSVLDAFSLDPLSSVDDGGILGVKLLADDSVISAFSGMPGNAGVAESGQGRGGKTSNGRCSSGDAVSGGNSYTGAGGNAAGGNVVHNGKQGLTLIKVFSDNAGNGGVALSGSGRGGNAGSVIC